MADRSQYLAQALQDMQSAPAITMQQPDLAAMQRQAQAKRAFEAANPGQSYLGHNITQMGQQIGAGPLGKLAGIFGTGPTGAPVDPNAAPWAMSGLPGQ